MEKEEFLKYFDDEDIKTSTKALKEALAEETRAMTPDEKERERSLNLLWKTLEKENVKADEALYFTDATPLYFQQFNSDVAHICFSEEGRFPHVSLETDNSLDHLNANFTMASAVARRHFVDDFPLIPLLTPYLHKVVLNASKTPKDKTKRLFKWKCDLNGYVYHMDAEVLKHVLGTLGETPIRISVTDKLSDGLLFSNSKGIAQVYYQTYQKPTKTKTSKAKTKAKKESRSRKKASDSLKLVTKKSKSKNNTKRKKD